MSLLWETLNTGSNLRNANNEYQSQTNRNMPLTVLFHILAIILIPPRMGIVKRVLVFGVFRQLPFKTNSKLFGRFFKENRYCNNPWSTYSFALSYLSTYTPNNRCLWELWFTPTQLNFIILACSCSIFTSVRPEKLAGALSWFNSYLHSSLTLYYQDVN